MRRKEILEAHGHDFFMIPSEIEEALPEDADFAPEELTIYLAEQKATAVFKTLRHEDWPNGCAIIGVDTIVYKDKIIGKPVDEEDALAILRSLKNTSHEVISGVYIIHALPLHVTRSATGPPYTRMAAVEKEKFADVTTVRFGDYTDEEILEYIRANPPYDKSGSYAIQSDWGRHVLEMEGDIENVIGLPYSRLAEYL
jgi:septum formation protein